jgi:hypothetical protein
MSLLNTGDKRFVALDKLSKEMRQEIRVSYNI